MEINWKEAQDMKCDKNYMLLYAVTDRSWLGNKTLAMQVEETLRGGATCIQLREKELTEEKFLQEALIIKDLCLRYHVPFIINDNVEVAIKCGADGVHVGQSDLNACKVRKLIGEDMILGVSVQTVEQAVQAEENGADYLGVGTVFTTSTKPDADFVNYNTLKAICKNVSVPVVAIGGINSENILELQGSSIDGVALVSAIFASHNIEMESEKLLKLSESVVKNENKRY